jgi:hypothetical protein
MDDFQKQMVLFCPINQSESTMIGAMYKPESLFNQCFGMCKKRDEDLPGW